MQFHGSVVQCAGPAHNAFEFSKYLNQNPVHNRPTFDTALDTMSSSSPLSASSDDEGSHCSMCGDLFICCFHKWMTVGPGHVFDYILQTRAVIRSSRPGLCVECKFVEDSLLGMRSPAARFKRSPVVKSQ